MFLGSMLGWLMTGAHVSHAAVELQSASQLRKGAADGTESEKERGRQI